MSWKAAVSKPGHNVLTDTTPDDLIFSSDYNTLKYYVNGGYTLTANSDQTVTIAHNLGYIPFYTCFCNAPGINTVGISNTYAMTEYFSTFGGQFVAVKALIDTTNLYLIAIVGDGNTYTFNFYYKIFTNSLNL